MSLLELTTPTMLATQNWSTPMSIWAGRKRGKNMTVCQEVKHSQEMKERWNLIFKRTIHASITEWLRGLISNWYTVKTKAILGLQLFLIIFMLCVLAYSFYVSLAEIDPSAHSVLEHVGACLILFDFKFSATNFAGTTDGSPDHMCRHHQPSHGRVQWLVVKARANRRAAHPL